MTRTLFTVGRNVYELDAELKSRVLDKCSRQDATRAWFDGPVLWMAYETCDCETPRCELESVNVVDVFETLPGDALETLNSIGAEPIIQEESPIRADDSTVVDVREFA